ncbi:MAG: sulfatase [Planctomycetota bacterium]
MSRCLLGLFFLFSTVTAFGVERPNVLFIAVDDLRPALGCYGDKTAISPNIDRLAARGTVFERAYCQQAVCAPSRLSLMTGRRPDTTRVWDLKTHFRKQLPDVVTLPQYFGKRGYVTQSLGKIFHGGGVASEDRPSWSRPPLFAVTRDKKFRYASPANLKMRGHKASAAESVDVPDVTYVDGMVCEAAEKTLDSLAREKAPFFLAVGFRKPHLPFCAPKKYWDLYDRAKIPGPLTTEHPEGAPELATRSWRELEGYTDIPKDGKLSRERVQELRHGYYACVSYADALIGRVLDRLRSLGLEEKTLVVLWGDHGFHLAEQGLWTKANNYELSTRVPLIVAAPQRTSSRVRALVELVDLYPTLVDLCGFAPDEKLEGSSFVRLLSEPHAPWKRAAFSQYPRPPKGVRHNGRGEVMGYAIRTEQYRYVEWRRWSDGAVVARELYDEWDDPFEMRNRASDPGCELTVDRLSHWLRAGWGASRPNSWRTAK